MEACSTDFKKIYKASEIAEPEFQTDNSEILELLVTFDKRQLCQGYQKTQHPSRCCSNKHAINWEMCMFCQRMDGKKIA